MQYSKEDVEQGSERLKEILVRWKDEVKDGNMTRDEMVSKMKELVASDAALLENPFFKSVKAL
jgi:DNA mismatch repair protein MSH2